MTLLFVYATVVGIVLAIAAAALERAAAGLRRPRRAIWAGALLVNVTLGTIMFARQAPPSVWSTTDVIAATVFRGMAIGAAGRTPAAAALPGALDRLDASSRRVVAFLDPALRTAWIAGTAGLALLFAFGRAAMARRRRGWREVVIDDRRVFVGLHDGPAVVGVWCTSVVLPEWALALERDALGLMIDHERAHERARDPLLIHLSALAVALMPWNAAAWWMLSRLRLAIEVDCDARVVGPLRESTIAQVYAQLLLTAASKRSVRPSFMAPAMIERSNDLARRISAMFPHPRRFSAVRVTIASGLALLFVTAAVTLPMPTLRAQSAPAFSHGRDVPLPLQTPATRISTAGGRIAPRPVPSQDADEPVYKLGQRVGGPVTFPAPIKQVNPTYTKAAMDAKVQGMVRLAAVVKKDGTVDRVRVTQSLDVTYGLDQAAIDAATQWQFEPATKDGQPVAVEVEMEFEFRLS